MQPAAIRSTNDHLRLRRSRIGSPLKLQTNGQIECLLLQLYAEGRAEQVVRRGRGSLVGLRVAGPTRQTAKSRAVAAGSGLNESVQLLMALRTSRQPVRGTSQASAFGDNSSMRNKWQWVAGAIVLLCSCSAQSGPTTKLGNETVPVEKVHGKTDRFGLPLEIVLEPPPVPKEISDPSPPIVEAPKTPANRSAPPVKETPKTPAAKATPPVRETPKPPAKK
jgi:hypothetical protein